MSPAPQSAEPIRMAAGKGQPRQASGGGRGRGAAGSGSLQANKRRCKFFFSNKGCRRGSDCRYSHESDENELDAAQASTSSSSSANNDAPCSTVLISASENESDDEIAHEKQARHCKKKSLQDMTRGGRSSPNNGRRSPQDRNDKNSRPASSETFTSIISASSVSSNNTLQYVQGTEQDTNVIILEGLQSQVQVAMKQLAVLQTHANLLQESLLQMSEQVNSASSSIIMNQSSMNKHDSSIMGRNERVGGSHFTDTVVDNEDRDPVEEPAEFGRSKNRGGRRNCTESVIVSTRNNGSRGQQSTYEMVQPVNIDEGRTTIAAAGGAEMRGEQVEKVETQRGQEDEDKLAHRPKREDMHSPVACGLMPDLGILPPFLGQENAIVHHKDCEWVCSTCTLINQKPSLTCVACGSRADGEEEEEFPLLSASTSRSTINGNAAATTMPQELRRAEATKRQEEKARKKREKSERKKAELARKKEEERVAAEAEKKRQLEMKCERQALMAKHEAAQRKENERAAAEAEKQRQIEGSCEMQEIVMEKHEAVVEQSIQRMEDPKSSLNVNSTPFIPFSTGGNRKSELDAGSAPFVPSSRKVGNAPSPSRQVVAKNKTGEELTQMMEEKRVVSAVMKQKLEQSEQKIQHSNVARSSPSRKLATSCKSTNMNMNVLLSAKNEEPLAEDQLSLYIKSKPRTQSGGTNLSGREVSSDGIPTGSAVSPIFDMLQNNSTANGRRLLVLETDAHKCKEEYNKLIAQRTRLRKGVQAEGKIIKKSEEEIAELERKLSSKWMISIKNIFNGGGGKNVQKVLEEKDKVIDEELERQLKDEVIDEELEKERDLDAWLNLWHDTFAKRSDDEPASTPAPATLEELMNNCAALLRGSPSEYTLWLRSEGFNTISDLGIGVIDEVEKLVRGNGDVGILRESQQEFTSTILDAVSGGSVVNEAAPPEEKELTKEEKEAYKQKEREKRAQKMRKIAEERKFNRHKEVTGARKRIEQLNKVIKSSENSIESQKAQLTKLQNPILIKTKQLSKLRGDIARIKVDAIAIEENLKDTCIEEDTNFHIDRSRDDRGFTFLMVAAQNDDFLTAKTCFELGADAYVKSPEGLTAIDFSFFFEHKRVTNLILQNGGSLPQKQSEAWNSLQSMTPQSADSSRSWDDALKVAESAALPAETLMESPEECETDEDKRMHILTSQARSNMDFTCFESRLIDSNINPDQVQRVVLLEQKVYNWCMSADPTTRSNFIDVLEGLKPPSVRRPGVNATKIHRRAMVGTTTTFEVLASLFEDVSKEKDAERDQVVLFSPFVSGEVEGVTSIGVLAWAVVPDSEASLYKTLVANTEFMRHKVALDDRFLEHREGVLKLGKDMHLLDLQSTSIWTTATMALYILNVDQGDLDRISYSGFSAKKRIVHSEEQVNKAIFRTSQAEANDNEGILASERLDMSSLVSGGAGTGKTLLMIRKVASEEPSRHVLVVTRLPRLVNVIKTAVEEKRDDGVENLSFTTYDDLVQLLARRVVPDDDSHCESFVQFNRVRFDCDDSNISFLREFIDDFLNSKERTEMKSHEIDPLTLWHAVIVIKSNSNCARTKQPLSLDDYLALPISFGLTKTQRNLCYDIFLKYEEWRHNGHYWDEMDRVLYVMRHGPTVFRDDKFISWAARVNKFGEMDLLDDEGAPLYPFFYDVVCADEAQDFTEIDLLLFIKMSASIRSLFLSADVAQSVEVGVNMRAATVNDVFYSLVKDGKHKVKDVLQYIDLQMNHRTHAQNLAIGQAVRSILARSFQIPMTRELALIDGELPKTMMIKKIRDLADASTFQGGNIVFVAPDEKVHELRLQFQALEIHNDVFGVREAKGLEFDACALLGFFGHFDKLGSNDEWQNVLRWLSSSSTTTKTSSTGEKVDGLMLTDCDYRLSAPNVSDEAMMLYTALTRARNHLYLIELESASKGKQQSKSLAQFAFRRLKDLGLVKPVSFIKEGHVEEITPAEHKARGVLYVTQALNMSRNMEPFSNVKDKFMEAMSRFAPEKGNDKDLLDKCEKHLDALTKMHGLMKFAKEKFLRGGVYNLEGRFAEVLEFEQMASEFFSQFLCDSFLVGEVHAVRLLIEEVFFRTPYEKHFKSICATVEELEQGVV